MTGADGEMSNVPTVQKLYGLLAQGESDAALDLMADDVRLDVWDPPSPAQDVIPYAEPHTGKAEMVAAQARLADLLEVHDLRPVNFLEGGHQVIVVLRIDATVRATGKRFQDLEFHMWTFGDDGRVTDLRHVIDTAKQMAANQS